MRLKIYSLLFSLALMGCGKNNDDHVYTLYSSYKNNRLHVATFDTTPISWDDKKTDAQFKKWTEEENFIGCKKSCRITRKRLEKYSSNR